MDSLIKPVRRVAVPVAVLVHVSQIQTAQVAAHGLMIDDALVTMAAPTTDASQTADALLVRGDLPMTIVLVDQALRHSSATADQAQRLKIRGRVRIRVL